jgi:Ras GTPase-activating-like protein IQGAP2/3
MPNFGNVGRDLAKEINEEPEETDDERRIHPYHSLLVTYLEAGRDRLLLENEGSIIATQCAARGFLIRKAQATKHIRIRLAEKHVTKLQTLCRGVLARRKMDGERQKQARLVPWAIALQATARSLLVRRRWHSHLRRIKGSPRYVVKIQAQARGYLIRRRLLRLKSALRTSNTSVAKFQSLARGHITRNLHQELKKTFAHRSVVLSVTALQAHARGALARRAASQKVLALRRFEPAFTILQACCRGVVVRRRMRTQLAKLEDVTHVVIRIQAAVRTYLARKRLLTLIRGLRRATPAIVSFQAKARATLRRQQHRDVNKALAAVSVISSVGRIQALARAALMRNRHREQHKILDVLAPDIVGFQAACRGALVRQDYLAWRDHLWENENVASILQAMLRGALQRRRFHVKMQYYRANLDKVVKIQSLFRAKETREQYRQLTLGTNVSVGTIKNFVHLLDDSEADFQEEIKVEQLRKKVVEGIRENQALENDVSDLDVKIALVVQNVKSFEELIKARRRHGADSAAAHAARASVLAAHGDPFAGPNTLDHAAKRKLELYQQLFHLLQTQGEYLSRLFTLLSMSQASEKNRRLTERVVLTLFGYGQDRREDYLLLKLLQVCCPETMLLAID